MEKDETNQKSIFSVFVGERLTRSKEYVHHQKTQNNTHKVQHNTHTHTYTKIYKQRNMQTHAKSEMP
jgi:hypothetical protein